MPTLYIIGTKDPLVPVNGGEAKTPWGIRNHPPLTEPLSKWATAIGCEAEPKVVSDKGGVKTVEYPSKTSGPTLTVIYIDGQGHHWPGGKAALPDSIMGPNTNTLNATDTLWEFFKSSTKAVSPQKPEPKTDNGDRSSLNWTTRPIQADRVDFPTLRGRSQMGVACLMRSQFDGERSVERDGVYRGV